MSHQTKLTDLNSRPDYPFSSLAKANQKIDDNIFEFNNSCSTTDCTGLIPAAPVRDGALESYEELYPYLPPEYGLDSGH